MGGCLLSVLVCPILQAQTPSHTPLTVEQKSTLEEAEKLTRNALELLEAKKLDEAIRLAKRALELKEGVFGGKSVQAGQARSNVASLYVTKQSFDRAETEYLKVLAIYENANYFTPNTVYVLDSLALLRWRLRDDRKAEGYAKRAISLREQIYGNESPELFDSLDYLAKIYDSAGKISDRNTLYLRVVSILEKRQVRRIDRPLLFRYHCSLRSGKQSADTAASLKRIEVLLSWDPENAKVPADGGILNGRALLLATPEYPAQARAVGASGTVSVEVEIDECGYVVSTKVLSGSSFLRRVSEAAARQSRFSPTMVDGTPVKVKGVIQYNFSRRKP